ncbi:MAG TPA: hypothetical protein VJS67_03655 [Pseudonocardiaceae bacterium]|jgi:hypothetical protein|nr:hypothetical protein [Pseudonocardiaceae bacterium]
MADHESHMDGGCAEPELSAELRDALTLLQQHSDDDEFRTLIDDVLAGRCSLMEASGSAAFSNVVFASIAQEYGRMTDDDKRRLTSHAHAASADSPGGETGPCGSPCATCTGICTALRNGCSGH